MIKYFILFSLLTSLSISAQENSGKDGDITQIKDYDVLKTKIDLTDIYTTVDTPPEFPGGIWAFRNKFAEIFPISNFDEKSGTILKTTAYFIIEKDGKMGNVIAIGDKRYSLAAQKALKQINGLWKPARLNGEPVRFIHALPLTMSF
ncbi:MAG: hypothetical protein I8H68_02550 [Flavobacteriia bacterium]|nr:hypothetical protein [Flavobacteriia bacterium]MBH2023584.1 hypothetical protein [Flavobacteriales bacterium]